MKTKIEQPVKNLTYSGIEWRAHNVLQLTKEQKEKVIIMLESLDEIDDIQKIRVSLFLKESILVGNKNSYLFLFNFRFYPFQGC